MIFGLLCGPGCSSNDVVKQYEAWADEACACADAACRTASVARGVRLVGETQAARGSAADARALKAAADRAARCLAVASVAP